MAYSFTLDATTPADADVVSAGAGKIRALTLSLSERLASVFVNVNADPLVFKAFSQSTGTAALNVVTIAGTLTVSGASSFTVTGTVPAALNRGDSAALAGYLTISRVGTVRGYLGLDASDNITFLSADAAHANLTLTDAGVVTIRSTLLVNGGVLNFSNLTGSAKIIGGTVGTSFRNSVDSLDNLFVSDAGVVTARSNVNTTGVYQVSGTQVLGARNTGWSAQSESPVKGSFGSPGAYVLSDLGKWASAIQAALVLHGILGV